MIRVNLLPYREEKRKAKRQQFYALLAAVVVLAGFIWFVGFTAINSAISTQQAKNQFLEKEIDVLKKDIDEISRLKEQTDALLKRKQVIESLQSNRAETLRVFDELLRRVPDGVRLLSLSENGIAIDVNGEAISEARVSTLMRNLEESPIFENVAAVEIRAATAGNGRPIFQFAIKMQIERQAPATAKGGVPTPPAKDAKT